MNLMISPFSKEDLSFANQLFNTCVESDLPYKKMHEDEWTSLFFDDTIQAKKILIKAEVNRAFVGFSAGCMAKSGGDSYVTFLLVSQEFRQMGIGRKLLEALEEALKACRIQAGFSETGFKVQISFFNPCALTWLIPGTLGHDHPNAPGVDIASTAYKFFTVRGYTPFAIQNSFYLPLKEYAQPADITLKRTHLKDAGITFEFYNSLTHYGLEELCDDLGNPMWKEELTANNAAGRDARPLMAAIRKNQIVGFTGPLRVQESGRGYFAGIGVHSSCRGLGLGNLLFHLLCSSLKELGADFMTLFTGETNPAAEIYKKAGFQIVKTWADMEKQF